MPKPGEARTPSATDTFDPSNAKHANPVQPIQNSRQKVESTRKRKAKGRVESAVARYEEFHAALVGSTRILTTERPGLLAAEHPLERTHKLRQPALLAQVDKATQLRASFHLDLSESNLQPYQFTRYSRSGKTLLIGSQRGHVALSTWRSADLQCELHLNETVRDGLILHNDNFYAIAQKKYTYIYDASGTQLHVLREHRCPGRLAFLPHHFLLASASAAVADEPRLSYTDTSTGKLVADLTFGSRSLNIGNVQDTAVNLSNGVLNLAHSNGVVSQWSPVQTIPLARVFTHPGGVSHVCCSMDGLYMITAGADATIRTWDLRTYKQMDVWKLPANPSALAISQRGLIAAGFGATVHVFADPTIGPQATKPPQNASTSRDTASSGRPVLRSPYMMQQYPKRKISCLEFCPFEDVLAVTHCNGMASMVVPGAGEPTFDTSAPNPYASFKQLRESEIGNLIDKLRPETIALDVSHIGGVDPDPVARVAEMRARIEREEVEKVAKSMKKKRAKGRGKISKQLRRKQNNSAVAKRAGLRQERGKDGKERQLKSRNRSDTEEPMVLAALQRFVKRRPNN